MSPNFDVIINGSPIPANVAAHIISVRVDDDTDLLSMFTLELTGSEQRHRESQWVDNPLFAVGNVVEVKLGEGKLDSLIIGEITGLEPEFTFNRLPSLIVRGYDRRHRLQRGRKTRTFIQQKVSNIAAQIASEAGLTAQTEDSQVIYDYVLQANQTDLEFLQKWANQMQYEVVVEDKKLFFRRVTNANKEILTLTFNDDLLEFYPRLSTVGQVSEVTVRGWNYKDKKEILGQAKIGNEVSKMGGNASGAELVKRGFGTAIEIVSNYPITSQAQGDQVAKAHFNQEVMGLIIGEGVCRGRTDLRSGKVIKIDGIGQRFSGQYYVTTASHRYGAQGYYTHFTVRRNAT